MVLSSDLIERGVKWYCLFDFFCVIVCGRVLGSLKFIRPFQRSVSLGLALIYNSDGATHSKGTRSQLMHNIDTILVKWFHSILLILKWILFYFKPYCSRLNLFSWLTGFSMLLYWQFFHPKWSFDEVMAKLRRLQLHFWISEYGTFSVRHMEVLGLNVSYRY